MVGECCSQRLCEAELHKLSSKEYDHNRDPVLGEDRQPKLVYDFRTIDRKMLRKWERDADNDEYQSRGQPINKDFEVAVLSELIFVKLLLPGEDGTAGTADIKVVANCAFTRENVYVAAKKVQGLAAWAGDKAVRKLKFSDGWVTDFFGAIHSRSAAYNEQG